MYVQTSTCLDDTSQCLRHGLVKSLTVSVTNGTLPWGTTSRRVTGARIYIPLVTFYRHFYKCAHTQAYKFILLYVYTYILTEILQL